MILYIFYTLKDGQNQAICKYINLSLTSGAWGWQAQRKFQSHIFGLFTDLGCRVCFGKVET